MIKEETKKIYGIIGIHQQRVDGIIGVEPFERESSQTLYVDVKIKVDLAPSIRSGQLSDTADYTSLARFCTALASKKTYHLVEEFASDLLEACKKQYNPRWVWVQVRKPAAIATAEYAFVEIEYHQEGVP